jgi:hypothetical protein
LLYAIFFIDEETGIPNIGGIFACYFFPTCTVLIFWCMFNSYFNNDRDFKGEYEKLHAKTERRKERMREWLKQHPVHRRKARKWE